MGREENIMGKEENAGYHGPSGRTSDNKSDSIYLDSRDKINVTEKLKFVLGRVENILGKGENAGYQHFLFPIMLSKGLFLRIV